MEFDSQLGKIMLEAGILAGIYQWHEEAERIFKGLFEMKVGSEEPVIGYALTKIMANKSSEAVQILRDEALRFYPDSEMLKAFLALALKLAGNTYESEQTAQSVTATGKNQTAVRLASAVLKEEL